MMSMMDGHTQDEGASDVRVKEGETLLHVLARKGFATLCALHLQNKINHTNQIDRPDIEAADNDGNTPLHLGAAKGHIFVVKTLLDEGANINARNKNKETPLHLASANGHLEAVEDLLNRNASFSVVDGQQRSALYRAVESGYNLVVDLLVGAGSKFGQLPPVSFLDTSQTVADRGNMFLPRQPGMYGGFTYLPPSISQPCFCFLPRTTMLIVGPACPQPSVPQPPVRMWEPARPTGQHPLTPPSGSSQFHVTDIQDMLEFSDQGMDSNTRGWSHYHQMPAIAEIKPLPLGHTVRKSADLSDPLSWNKSIETQPLRNSRSELPTSTVLIRTGQHISNETNTSPPLPLGYVIFAFAIFFSIITPLNEINVMPANSTTTNLNAWTTSALQLIHVLDFILLRVMLLISLLRLPAVCTLVGLLVLIPATTPMSDTHDQNHFRITFVLVSTAIGLFAIAMLVKNCHHIEPSDQKCSLKQSDSADCSDMGWTVEEQCQKAVNSPMSSSDTIVGDLSTQSRSLTGTTSWEAAKPGMRPMTPDDDVLLQMMEAMM